MTQRFNQPRRATRASIRFKPIAFPALLLIAGGWLGGCDRLAAATSTDAQVKTGAPATPAIAVRAVAVRTLVVRRGTLRAELSYVGIVRPRRQVKVAARVGGTVARQLMEEGDTVKAGDVLVHIEVPELQAKAPVAGRVLRWLVEPGETVGPGRPLVLLATGASELEMQLARPAAM